MLPNGLAGDVQVPGRRPRSSNPVGLAVGVDLWERSRPIFAEIGQSRFGSAEAAGAVFVFIPFVCGDADCNLLGAVAGLFSELMVPPVSHQGTAFRCECHA